MANRVRGENGPTGPVRSTGSLPVTPVEGFGTPRPEPFGIFG
jgi:hypothetical protein